MKQLISLKMLSGLIVVMSFLVLFGFSLLVDVAREHQSDYFRPLHLFNNKAENLKQALQQYHNGYPGKVKAEISQTMKLSGLRKLIIFDLHQTAIYANNSAWLGLKVADLQVQYPDLEQLNLQGARKQLLLNQNDNVLQYVRTYQLPMAGNVNQISVYFEYEHLNPEAGFWQLAWLHLEQFWWFICLPPLALALLLYGYLLRPFGAVSQALQQDDSQRRTTLPEQGMAELNDISQGVNRLVQQQYLDRLQRQQTEQYQQSLYDVLNEAILWVDSGGKITAVNAAACELLDYSADTLSNFNLSHLPGLSGQLYEAFQQAQISHVAMTFEDTISHSYQQNSKYIRGTVVHLAPHLHSASQYVICIQDISAQRYLQQAIGQLAQVSWNADALPQLCNRLALALNMPWVFVLQKDPKAQRLFLLAGCEGQYFHGDAELIHSPLYNLFHNGDEILLGPQGKHKFGHDPYIKSINLQQFIAVPLTDSSGQVTAALCAMSETSGTFSDHMNLLRLAARVVEAEIRLKKQAQTIKDTQKTMLDLIDSVPHLISIRDQQHRLNLENEAARRFTAQLENLQQVSHTSQAVLAAAKVKQGETVREMREYQTKHGQQVFHDILCSSYVQTGRHQGMTLEVATDVTELMQAKTALVKKVNTLNGLNAIHRTLVAQSNLTQLYRDICSALCDQLKFSLALFARFNEQEQLELLACGGHQQSLAEQALLCVDYDKNMPPYKTARRHGKTQVVHDFNQHLNLPASHQLLGLGYKSLLIIPLAADEGVNDVLCLFSRQAHYFDQDDVEIFSQLGVDISLSTQHHQTVASKQQLEIQLIQTQKMESIGQLTAGIAHDFNNILASVLGFSELSLMKLGDSQPKVTDYLNQVVVAGRRARDLISQMLAFSRPEDLQADEPVCLSLAMGVHEGCRLLSTTLGPDVSLQHQVDVAEDIYAKISATEFHQILMNLVINARDAMDGKGEIQVHLRHHEHLQGIECRSCRQSFAGQYLELIVKDRGQGMEETTIRKIFSPFFTTKEVGKGTGMGLSVIHGLVHNLGGHIQVHSQVGHGSQFHIYFPVQQPEPAAIAAENHEPGAGLISAPNLAGKHVLLVDDEKGSLQYMEELLASFQAKVSAYSCSVSAAESFKQQPQAFDLVVTDLMMPKVTGAELIKLIRQYRDDLPVVAVTGHEQAEPGVEPGYQEKLAKPFAAESFAKMVSDALEQ